MNNKLWDKVECLAAQKSSYTRIQRRKVLLFACNINIPFTVIISLPSIVQVAPCCFCPWAWPGTEWFHARTCCAESKCKAMYEPFLNTLQCPLCEGFVHYQCAVFKLTEQIGTPVCLVCASAIVATASVKAEKGSPKKAAKG